MRFSGRRVACARARRSRSYNTRVYATLARPARRRGGAARAARTKPSIANSRRARRALAHGAASGRYAGVRFVEGGGGGRQRRLLALRRAEVVLGLGPRQRGRHAQPG